MLLKKVLEIVGEVSKTKEVDSENLSQSLDFIHACDVPPKEESIKNIYNENPGEILIVSIHVEDTFIDGILNDYHVDIEDSSDEEPLASQDNDENYD